VAALRQRARHLLETQRVRICHVEAQLTEQVAALFEQMQGEKQIALATQQELHGKLDQLERERMASLAAEGEAGQLLGEARDALSEAHDQQCQLRRQLTEASEMLVTQHLEIEDARNKSVDSQEPPAALIAELSRLEEECDHLRLELDTAQQGISSRANSSGDELRQRLETAVQEIRDLKARNEVLMSENAKLAHSTSGDTGTAPTADATSSGAGFDWEVQKQLLLSQLETDSDPDDAEHVQAKLTVEGAIRITDQMVAEKEQEIEELRLLLADQAGSIGDMAIGAAAVADVLEQDELIREERENLRQLQEEWREKLRQTEVDVSVERAKIARERLKLDEQIQHVESAQAALNENGGSLNSKHKGARGKWLSRLGLMEEKE
jgi:hypothetical protein